MTAPTAPPVNTGRVEGWPMPCLPFALTSSIESSTSVGSSGCCRAIILSLIDGEAFAQSADAAPYIRLDVGVAVLTLVAQRLEHVGDHVADFLELGDAEAARRAGGRSDADAAGLDRRQRVEGDDVLVESDRAALERLVGELGRAHV